jgi:hypothetical protein
MWLSNRAVCITGLIALLVLGGARCEAQSLAVVPGASGFGMATRAANGGSVSPTIYSVTNLNDSGEGSLRAALEAAEPRVVVFETSGMIELSSPIRMLGPYLTVAGQTAPSPGITVKGSLYVYTHDVLLQHLRIRPGSDPSATTCNNALEVYSSTDQYNIVFDHLSVSWAQHINIAISNSARPVDLTIWRSMVSEGLNSGLNASCPPFGTSYGMLVYTGTRNVSVVQSLVAHNDQRSPYSTGETTTYFANNLIYGFGDAGSMYNQPPGYGVVTGTVMGNSYIASPFTLSRPNAAYAISVDGLQTGSLLYRADNALDDGGSGKLLDFDLVNDDGIDPTAGSPPVTLSDYTPMPSSAVYDVVLAQAGARPTDRDAVDNRIVSEVQNRTGSVIETENEVGGYPTLAVNTRALTIPDSPHDVTPSGYTNLEIWLQDWAAAVEN